MEKLKYATIVVLIFFSALYLSAQTKVAPKGHCECNCWPKPETEVYDVKPCGPECEIISTDNVRTYKDSWYETDKSCVSGKREYSQEVTVTSVKRGTKLSGKYYVECQREGLPGESCKNCPSCPPYIKEYKCGDIVKLCDKNPGENKEIRGEKKDEGCSDTPA